MAHRSTRECVAPGVAVETESATTPFTIGLLTAVALFGVIALLATACRSPDVEDSTSNSPEPVELSDPPRRYSAEWLIDADAAGGDGPGFPFLYREVADDQRGEYLVLTHNHLARQTPEEVVFCAAVSRVPLDPYCASAPRAEGAPNVLAYPVQLLREWSPRALYDLAGHREVSLVAASDPGNWNRRVTESNGIPVECFLVTGSTPAADTGFEICFTDDDLHLVASVDLQNDLMFEVDLLSYRRFDIADDFETGLEEFFEERPSLQEQLLDLYPEVPAPRPTPTPVASG
jgi:hypothetical protein